MTDKTSIIELLTSLAEVIIPLLTGVVGWLVGRRKRNNDFIAELQGSINALVKKNAEQIDEIIKLRDEVVKLRSENFELSKEVDRLTAANQQLTQEVEALRKENETLNRQIQQLTSQLDNVKTITKSR